MSTAQERVWDLYQLKKSLEEQLTDVKGLLEQAQADAYAEGIRRLDNGYTIQRSETRDISVKKFSEQYPDIYKAAILTKVQTYEPELTKSDIKAAIKDAVQTKEEQDAILSSIENGIVQYRFSLKRPLDPKGRDVE